MTHLFRLKYVWTDNIEAAYFISSFWYLLNDIIAEVYGYKVAMKLFWSLFFSEILFIVICLIFSYINPANSKQMIYIFIFGKMWDEILVNPLVLLFVWWINTKIFLKFKFLLKGRYFWLRSISASSLSEILASTILTAKLFFFFSVQHAIMLSVWGSFFKLIFIALFSYPASLAVNILSSIEYAGQNKLKFKLNPFEKNQYR